MVTKKTQRNQRNPEKKEKKELTPEQQLALIKRARGRWKTYRGSCGTKRRVRALVRRLDQAYGPFKPKKQRAPLDGLILTILSQATNDKNSFRAFENLTTRFPSWDDVVTAKDLEIEEAIRSGGLARNKSKTIKKILKRLKVEKKGFKALDDLASEPLDMALAKMSALPGVGIKTASCVLLFEFQRPVMPVDTHVHRLSKRLDLVVEKASADHTHHVLMSITPAELIYPFHVWLIAHGRKVCQASNPNCGHCFLSGLCPSSK